jgi:hypothetical protein
MRLRARFFLFGAVVALFAALSAVAVAGSPHFKHGGEPVCTFSGTTSIPVTCTASLSGLGNQDLNVRLSASGSAVYQCRNNGGNIAPGQNKVLIGPATSNTAIPASQVKNGNLTFTTNPATLAASSTVSGAVAGCPGNNWTGVNPVVTLTSISLVIEQPPGTAIFTCSASNSNGLTSPVTLSC